MKSTESTYALIVRSEEKSRSVLEVVLYAVLILSAVFSIWQFAHQPVVVPAAGLSPSADIAVAHVESCVTARG
jgi:hypothetical protein